MKFAEILKLQAVHSVHKMKQLFKSSLYSDSREEYTRNHFVLRETPLVSAWKRSQSEDTVEIFPRLETFPQIFLEILETFPGWLLAQEFSKYSEYSGEYWSVRPDIGVKYLRISFSIIYPKIVSGVRRPLMELGVWAFKTYKIWMDKKSKNCFLVQNLVQPQG